MGVSDHEADCSFPQGLDTTTFSCLANLAKVTEELRMRFPYSTDSTNASAAFYT